MTEFNGLFNKVTQGDCLEVMKRIPDGSVDMILCDLPYGTTDAKWDSVIPFESLWAEYERVIKLNGSILLFGSEPFSSEVRNSNPELYRYDWYWVKSKPGLFQHSKNRPMKAVETISVFSKARWGHASQMKPENRMIYNPQGVRSSGIKTVTKNYNAGGVFGERPNQVGRKYESFTGFPSDVLHFGSVVGKDAIHSTQKPVDLCEYLIRTYTNEGEVVLDNCIGSGTTAVAAINTGRNFIGIELEPEYVEIAKRRVDEAIAEKEGDS